jgi:hypothetical protein
MEWISVKSKLPPEYQDVLLYQEHGGIFIGWLENGMWVVDYTFVEAEVPKTKVKGNVDQDEITYWRNMPPNPQWDFFDVERKTCDEWLFFCKNNVNLLNFNEQAEGQEIKKLWFTEKVTKEEFIKRLMLCSIERLSK